MTLLLWAILTKKHVRRRWLLIAAFGLSYILGNSFLLNEVIHKWEYPLTREEQIQGTYDVGIVLGGFSAYDTVYNRIKFHQSSDRLWQTFYLYKTGKIKKILISGGSGSLLRKKETEADRVFAFLLKLGVPANDMLMEAKSRNTRENAVESAKLINATQPDSRCILINFGHAYEKSIRLF
ncbi:MAG: YdcF family protein [Bacteroidales bacterium]|nr:YdcF family protein [Bacteroidales bacterium]